MSLANTANYLSGVTVWKCLRRLMGWRLGFPIWWCYWEVTRLWDAEHTKEGHIAKQAARRQGLVEGSRSLGHLLKRTSLCPTPSASWLPQGEQLSSCQMFLSCSRPEINWPGWLWNGSSEALSPNVFLPFKVIVLCSLSQQQKAD